MVVWLRVVKGALEGQAFPLANRQYVSLGRTIRADIVLNEDPQVSSLHCQIENSGSNVHLKDLGSTNGTYLNGQSVREAVLASGDVLRLGTTEIQIVFEGSVDGTGSQDGSHSGDDAYPAPPPAAEGHPADPGHRSPPPRPVAQGELPPLSPGLDLGHQPNQGVGGESRRPGSSPIGSVDSGIFTPSGRGLERESRPAASSKPPSVNC